MHAFLFYLLILGILTVLTSPRDGNKLQSFYVKRWHTLISRSQTSRAIWRVEFCSFLLSLTCLIHANILLACLYIFFLYLFFFCKDRQFHHLNENVVFVRQHSRFSLNDFLSLCFFFLLFIYTYIYLWAREF